MDIWFVLETPRDLKKSSSPSSSGLRMSREMEKEQPSEVEEEIMEVRRCCVLLLNFFLTKGSATAKWRRRRRRAGWNIAAAPRTRVLYEYIVLQVLHSSESS